MSFALNKISGERHPLACVMWADCDPEDRKTPVAVYASWSEQRSNRPDLKPIPVVVVALTDSLDDMQTQLTNTVAAVRLKSRKTKKPENHV